MPGTKSTIWCSVKNSRSVIQGVTLVVTMLVVGAGLVFVSGIATANSNGPSPDSSSGIARGNVKIDRYMEVNWAEELTQGLEYPARTPRVFLHGSWREMGVQYGEAVGPSIRAVFDALYAQWSQSDLDPETLPDVLDLYVEQIRDLSPEMIQFMRGIARGADGAFDQSLHAEALSDFHKIVFMNCLFEVAIPPAWDHVSQLTKGKQNSSTSSTKNQPQPTGFASHSWAAYGDATPFGGAVVGGTRDQPWFPLMYSTAYVAVPADPDANVVFGHTIAGMVAASNQVNDQGLYIGNTIVRSPQQQLGIPALVATAYVSFYADSASDAADMFTAGTKQYRDRTDRNTLAYTVGFNQLVADAGNALVVERTGNRYAVREAGDHDEQGSYVVLTNHNIADHSYDESATRTEEPMDDFGVGPEGSSKHRYYALFWQLARNHGQINVEVGKDSLAQMNHYYTPEGEKVTERDGVPVWRLGDTPQRFQFENPEDPDAFPQGGNLMYVVADLKNLDIYYVQGIPDHWSGPWDHVWLGNPAYQRPLR